MRIITTKLEGVLIIQPKHFKDARGSFFESYQAERYREHGIPDAFVQDNVSHSVKNVVRGLHYQLERPQGKLVFALYGKVMDVIVDIRRRSPTFGQSISVELSDENLQQVYIPPGFAHGFCVLSDSAGFFYKCTDYYHPSSERGIAWNDSALSIPWPVKTPILASKDASYPFLKEVDQDHLFP